MTQQPIIVFDVNETLLDLETLRATFERIFNDSAAMRLWFAGLITYSEALTLAGVYVPFTDIGAAVLRMLAATRGIEIGDADTAELTDRFASMPLVVWQRRDAATGRQWQRRDGGVQSPDPPSGGILSRSRASSVFSRPWDASHSADPPKPSSTSSNTRSIVPGIGACARGSRPSSSDL